MHPALEEAYQNWDERCGYDELRELEKLVLLERIVNVLEGDDNNIVGAAILIKEAIQELKL